MVKNFPILDSLDLRWTNKSPYKPDSGGPKQETTGSGTRDRKHRWVVRRGRFERQSGPHPGSSPKKGRDVFRLKSTLTGWLSVDTGTSISTEVEILSSHRNGRVDTPRSSPVGPQDDYAKTLTKIWGTLMKDWLCPTRVESCLSEVSYDPHSPLDLR